MGCGSSSQPAEGVPANGAAPDGSPEAVTKGECSSADKVEAFKVGDSPSPSPTKMTEKETLDEGDMPMPSAYRGDSFEEESRLQGGQQTDMMRSGSPMDSYSQPRNQPMSPGYKLEDEGRKIGKFDPESFRKANKPQAQGFFTQGANANQPPIDWTTPVPNGNSNNVGGNSGYGNQQSGYSNANNQNGYGNNGGYSNTATAPSNAGSGGDWNQRDYIQSDDIYSNNSPQAMQQGSQRMEFRDDPLADPFRAPGGLGHSDYAATGGNKRITREDDALMDEIINELEDL